MGTRGKMPNSSSGAENDCCNRRDVPVDVGLQNQQSHCCPNHAPTTNIRVCFLDSAKQRAQAMQPNMITPDIQNARPPNQLLPVPLNAPLVSSLRYQVQNIPGHLSMHSMSLSYVSPHENIMIQQHGGRTTPEMAQLLQRMSRRLNQLPVAPQIVQQQYNAIQWHALPSASPPQMECQIVQPPPLPGCGTGMSCNAARMGQASPQNNVPGPLPTPSCPPTLFPPCCSSPQSANFPKF